VGRRWAAWSLLLGGVAILGWSLAGLWATTGLRWLDTPPGPRWLTFLIGWLLVVLAAAAAPRRGVLQAVLGIVGVLGLLLAVLVAVTVESFTDDVSQVLAVPSPDGSAVAVVRQGTALIVPVNEVRVRRGGGPLEREWVVTCWSTENPDREVTDVIWLGNDRVQVVTRDGSTFTTGLAPSGRPEQVARDVC
jgi:hypothetical protein